MALTLQNLKLGGNLEFSWYSCNILRYCSNRCIVWFFIPANCPAQANRKFPVQLYVKIQILFEPPFWICKWANHLSFLAMLCRRLLYQSIKKTIASKNYLTVNRQHKLVNWPIQNKLVNIMFNSSMTSFFRFANKRASYPFGIISLAHAPYCCCHCMICPS